MALNEKDNVDVYAYLIERAKDSAALSEAFLKLADDINDLARGNQHWAIAQEYLVAEAHERSKSFSMLSELLEKKANSITTT